MPDNNTLFELRVGEIVFRPTRPSQFVSWTEKERETWAWLQNANSRLPPHIGAEIVSRYARIVGFANDFANGEGGTSDPQGLFDSMYRGNPATIIHSSSDVGKSILSIHSSIGAEEAAIAYGILTGRINMEVHNPLHFRAMSLATNPGMIDRTATRAANRADYARWQNEASALLIKHDTLLAEKERLIADLSGQADELAVRTYWKSARRSVALRKAVRREADKSISNISNVAKSYSEGMKLRASVQYWNEKKDIHTANRKTAYEHLRNFAIAGSFLSAISFWLAISFMLEASGVDVVSWMSIDPPEGRAVVISTFLVVSVALGMVMTAVFWTARVLLRHYLTERRLEGDAEERRVMTQTYLALINEGGAEEGDRLIILNALFRPAPDQPSGEDSGVEVALPALLAKLMDQRAAR